MRNYVYDTPLLAYQYKGFISGISQAVDGNLLKPQYSPDAMNMIISDGIIKTALGHEKYILTEVGASIVRIAAFYLYSEGVRTLYVIATTENDIFYWTGAAWSSIKGSETITNGEFQFINYQDGMNQIIIMTNGTDPVYKWTGFGNISVLYQKYTRLKSIDNEVQTPQFSTDSNWNSSGGSYSISGNTMVITGEFYNIVRAYQDTTIAAVAGEKFYIKARVKLSTGGYGRGIRIGIIGSTGGILEAGVTEMAIVADEWHDLSAVLTVDSDFTGFVRVCIDGCFVTASYAVGAIVTISGTGNYGVLCIPLTTEYGAGNEPSVDKCDDIFDNYFEGVPYTYNAGYNFTVDSWDSETGTITIKEKLSSADSTALSYTPITIADITDNSKHAAIISSAVAGDAGVATLNVESSIDFSPAVGDYIFSGTEAPRGEVITLHNERVWLSRLKDEPTRLYYSDDLNPGGWEFGTDDSGEIETPGWDGDKIIGIKNVFDNIIAFKQRSLVALAGLAPPYTKEEIYAADGCIAKDSICLAHDRAFYMSNRGIVEYAGTKAEILKPYALRDIYSVIDQNNIYKACGVVHDGKLYMSMCLWEAWHAFRNDTNLVSNPQFESGTTGYTGIGGTLSASGNILSATGDNSDESIEIQQVTTYDLDALSRDISLHYIQTQFRVRVTDSDCLKIKVKTEGSTDQKWATWETIVEMPEANKWYYFHKRGGAWLDEIGAGGDEGYLVLRIAAEYADAATANGKVVQLDGREKYGVLMIDITELYGYRGEPNYLLSYYSYGYNDYGYLAVYDSVWDYFYDYYFVEPFNNAVIEYDLATQALMIRYLPIQNFLIIDELLYFIKAWDEYIYQYNSGTDDDGNEIQAYWYTPESDMGYPQSYKHLQYIDIDCWADEEGMQLMVSVTCDGSISEVQTIDLSVVRQEQRISFKSRGRKLGFKIGNVNGSLINVAGITAYSEVEEA